MLPRSIKILGQRYKIKYKDLLSMNAAGMFDAENNTIWLDKSLKNKPEHLLRTFFHEFGHAVMYRNAVTFSGMPHYMEEVIVETYATCIYEFLIDIGAIDLDG